MASASYARWGKILQVVVKGVGEMASLCKREVGLDVKGKIGWKANDLFSASDEDYNFPFRFGDSDSYLLHCCSQQTVPVAYSLETLASLE